MLLCIDVICYLVHNQLLEHIDIINEALVASVCSRDVYLSMSLEAAYAQLYNFQCDLLCIFDVRLRV